MPGRAEYQALIDKVDAFTARVEAAQGRWLRCGAGCDGCCRLRRSAWAVEIDHLRRHVAELPAARRAELAERRNDPEVRAGARCVMLDGDGRCAVYAARPLICRTHGPAVRLPEGQLSWCDLNFADLTPEAVTEAVPADGILDLELLNRMLALINARFLAGCAARGESVAERAGLEAALDSGARGADGRREVG